MRIHIAYQRNSAVVFLPAAAHNYEHAYEDDSQAVAVAVVVAVPAARMTPSHAHAEVVLSFAFSSSKYRLKRIKTRLSEYDDVTIARTSSSSNRLAVTPVLPLFHSWWLRKHHHEWKNGKKGVTVTTLSYDSTP